MLRDYELKGEKHHFFIETNAEPQVLETILADYKKSVKNISPGGFMRYIRRYGYRVNELVSSIGDERLILDFNPDLKKELATV
jgi:hypothetical protein